MPSIAPRPCTWPGCGRLVPGGGPCEEHRRAQDRRRGKTAERGYDAAWRRAREAKLATDPICEIRTHCLGAVATEVDHIVPIEQAPELRLVWSNLQSACKPCNVAKAHRKPQKTADFGPESSRFVAL